MKQLLCFYLSLLLVTWFVVSADEKADHLYGHLLKELVRVNENRMDTIAKLSKPTKFDFAKTLQRTLENQQQQNVEKDSVVVLVLDLPSNSIGKKAEERTDVEGRHSDAIGNVFTINPDPERSYRNLMSERIRNHLQNLLRSDWLKACRKNAEKKCLQACKDSVKNVCTKGSCKRHMRKKFKKECKTSCKNVFKPKSDSEESDSDYNECTGRSGCKS